LLSNDQHFQPSLPVLISRIETILCPKPRVTTCVLYCKYFPPSNTFYRRTYFKPFLRSQNLRQTPTQQSHYYCCSAQPHGNKEKPPLKIIYRRKFFRETKLREINIKRKDGQNFSMHLRDSGKIIPVTICGL